MRQNEKKVRNLLNRILSPGGHAYGRAYFWEGIGEHPLYKYKFVHISHLGVKHI